MLRAIINRLSMTLTTPRSRAELKTQLHVMCVVNHVGRIDRNHILILLFMLPQQHSLPRNEQNSAFLHCSCNRQVVESCTGRAARRPGPARTGRAWARNSQILTGLAGYGPRYHRTGPGRAGPGSVGPCRPVVVLRSSCVKFQTEQR